MEIDTKAQETRKTPVCEGRDVNIELSEKKSKKESKGIIGLLAIIIAINITVTFAVLYVYDRYYAQKIVAVDIKGFIEEQRDQFIGKKIDEEQLKANIDAMEGKVRSMPKNKIMVLRDVIVGNAEIIKP